jgi:hypothetical protein
MLCCQRDEAQAVGAAANVLSGAWRVDGTVALGIAGWAVIEGRRAWAGQNCACVSQPGRQTLLLAIGRCDC